ncbi:hypothetical protein [Tessaracoccus flavus]|uniref:Uncharacterized protein n=1 Tax=Tessaracoccus flavus TaxID=1610493 RepID=A0A1Q2CDU2_9ACTN|nr:hypothetical protein [Tessaracoccus flavus]AQP44276.1 hypothetical protein RPIT_05155 [Tessaracoccus flavus]SDY40354.1 hypothetical protein SAMN05428934_101637 [Tessaracoccus flavus]
MTQQENPQPGPDGHAAVPAPLAAHFPLREADPLKVGDFWLDSRLTAGPAGVTFSAHEDGGDSVMLMLLSEGAAADPAARARFSGEINAMHIDTVVARGGEGQQDGRMGVRYRDSAAAPQLGQHSAQAPWAALAFDGSLAAVQEADRVLQAIDLSRTPPLSEPSGPDYRLHWIDKTAPGPSRQWPLAWPTRKDRAGWITVLTSFLLMVLLTFLALLLAILVFQNQPPVNAPQPIPSPASGEGSGSGEPQSGEPSQSGEGSGSPEPSPGQDGGPYSDSPSMNQPSGDQTGPGAPSPNPRL